MVSLQHGLVFTSRICSVGHCRNLQRLSGQVSKSMKTLLIIPVILLLTGCTCTPVYTPEITEDSAIITTKVGEEFTITLDSNPTTGYQWKLSDNFTEGVVRLVKSEYVAPETEMVGAGGQEVWTFKAIEPGETTIDMEYVRPWETGIEPVVVKSFGVTVE